MVLMGFMQIDRLDLFAETELANESYSLSSKHHQLNLYMLL